MGEQVEGALVVRPARGGDQDLRAGAGLVGADDLGVLDILLVGGPGHDLVEGGLADLLGGVAAVDDQQQGGLTARAEGLADQVGGLALGGARRSRRVARQREVQVVQRHREGAEADDDEQHDGDRGLAQSTRPAHAVVEDQSVLVTLDVVLADAGAEGLGLQHAENRWQQSQRHHHREQHRAGRGQAHAGQERDPDHAERGECNQHGETGEDDGRARRTDGATDRLPAVLGVVELGAVAHQDEQRVVDPDGQPDHGGQDRVWWSRSW